MRHGVDFHRAAAHRARAGIQATAIEERIVEQLADLAPGLRDVVRDRALEVRSERSIHASLTCSAPRRIARPNHGEQRARGQRNRRSTSGAVSERNDSGSNGRQTICGRSRAPQSPESGIASNKRTPPPGRSEPQVRCPTTAACNDEASAGLGRVGRGYLLHGNWRFSGGFPPEGQSTVSPYFVAVGFISSFPSRRGVFVKPPFER